MGESRLERRIGFGGAMVLGLGAMLGAGVFGAVAPAAAAAGSGLLIALCIAAALAACNATASARLGARHPRSGGAYVYAGHHLGPTAGFAAGWCFIIGKVASCTAIALVVGAHLVPGHARMVGVAAVVACTVVNHRGVGKTVAATAAILVVVAAGLLAAVAGTLGGGHAGTAGFAHPLDAGMGGILEAAGLLFFAFAGYARLSTLGEEVRDPARTIPRAIGLTVVAAFLVYLAVMASALSAVGPAALAASAEPLVDAVRAGGLSALAPVIAIAGTVAGVGVLLSLLAGVGRTTYAMAANHDLPRALGAVHPRYRVPHTAGIVTALAVIGGITVLDLRQAIALSSVLVLAYYALANASATRLPGGALRAVAVAGVAGCLVVALSLPAPAVLTGGGLLLLGLSARVAIPRPARTQRG